MNEIDAVMLRSVAQDLAAQTDHLDMGARLAVAEFMLSILLREAVGRLGVDLEDAARVHRAHFEETVAGIRETIAKRERSS